MFDYLSKFYCDEPLGFFEDDPLRELPRDIRAALEGAADSLPGDFLPKLRGALRRMESNAFRTGTRFGGQLMLELMEIAD